MSKQGASSIVDGRYRTRGSRRKDTTRGSLVGYNWEIDGVELSLSSMVGLTTPYSMKIRGHINKKAVIVLIDCGGSHNFISSL